MNEKLAKLRAEARAVIAAFDPDGDIELTLDRLAAIGYRMEAVIRNCGPDTHSTTI